MGSCNNPQCKTGCKSMCGTKLFCNSCKKKQCQSCFTSSSNLQDSSSPLNFCSTCLSRSALPKSQQPEQKRNFIIPINLDPFQKDFRKGNLLGKGLFSDVFTVTRIEDNKNYALKVISLDKMCENDILDEFSKSALSPSSLLVNCYALYKYKRSYGILLEFMVTNLNNYIQHLEIKELQNEVSILIYQGIPENTIAYIIRETTKGLAYIHENNNIHRDLKSGNIFLNLKGQVKIGDFGLSASITREKDMRMTFAGSPLWMAPEVLDGRPYNFLCDVWSLGILCFELAEKNPPYHKAKNVNDLITRILNEPLPVLANGSLEFKEFVGYCLKVDPNERKRSDELLETEFLKNVDEDEAIKNIIETIGSMSLSK
ncbi:hypothetical protein SteCoe_28207 [Stentor coeruleus]|uniref:non-specific serine/threonine protein kinase n=1 Tax=Stentor coeruleus TaxID=5963 RepID=A0A1R2B999_9CILI|nr:hypothetical protein SteCoe_28207 [Stentor coeruleus]